MDKFKRTMQARSKQIELFNQDPLRSVESILNDIEHEDKQNNLQLRLILEPQKSCYLEVKMQDGWHFVAKGSIGDVRLSLNDIQKRLAIVRENDNQITP